MPPEPGVLSGNVSVLNRLIPRWFAYNHRSPVTYPNPLEFPK